ncbi:MAG TPA: hypothetical protein VN174_02985 [Candidatus Methanoperedens sp.]|nr:hypothetical protein [Candidatus Methanoperedens sp.]
MRTKSKIKVNVLLTVVGVVVVIFILFFIGLPAAGCVGSGGRVSITSECKSTSIFSNNCGYGACEPKYRVNKLSCQCWPGCFDGSKCVENGY